MLKIFIACLGTETNTFSNLPTGLNTFESTMLFRGDATRRTANLFSEPLHEWRRLAEERGDQVIEGLAAFAQPGGITTDSVYESLRDELVDNLRTAGEVDMVLLSMHGAMVAESYDDCEGDVIKCLRELAGPNVILGVELDLHCSLTEDMMNNTDAMVIFKEYPHVDATPRARELFDICIRAQSGEVKPVMAVHDTRMINLWRTPVEPMRSFVDEMRRAEKEDGVLSVSFAHGFPWQDVADTSAKMLVISDGDISLAKNTAQRFGEQIWKLRDACVQQTMSIDQSLDKVMSAIKGPLVLADVADNAGGGAASDSTFILRAVADRQVPDMLLGYFWDPLAVWICQEGGEGASLDLRIGGKCGITSGDPVDLRVTIKRILHDARQPFGSSEATMGTAVWVQGDNGLDLVLNSDRSQVFHPKGFEQLGIDLSAKRGIVVKSMQHFYAGFAPVASEIIYVNCPGAIPPDFGAIPYRKHTTPYWPRVDDPYST